MKNIIYAAAFILLILTNLFSIYMNIYPISIKEEKASNINYSSEVDKCFEVYDVVAASNCLRDWVEDFYNYTVRDERNYTNYGDINDIRINGGDCFDYTMLYKYYLESNDYITTRVILPKHTFLIAYDKNNTAYCTIDILNLNCLKFI